MYPPNPVKTYEVKFTGLASAVLNESKSACEEHARGELAHELPEDYYPPKIFFHCFKYNDRDFIAVGKGDHILIDTVAFEEGEELKEGPFKGKRIGMPRPDSE